MALDGTSTSIADILDHTVSKVRPSDGVTLGVFPAGPDPIGLAYDGSSGIISCGRVLCSTRVGVPIHEC
jgi:hypothetical protein